MERFKDEPRYWTMLSCWSSLSSSISLSSALSMLFFRSSLTETPVGISTCLTAMRSPFWASIPRKTEPKDPDPIRAPLILLIERSPRTQRIKRLERKLSFPKSQMRGRKERLTSSRHERLAVLVLGSLDDLLLLIFLIIILTLLLFAVIFLI
jgi:hypothetical protein